MTGRTVGNRTRAARAVAPAACAPPALAQVPSFWIRAIYGGITLVALMIARVTPGRARDRGAEAPSHRGTGPPKDKAMGLRRPGETPGPHRAVEPGGRHRTFARA